MKASVNSLRSRYPVITGHRGFQAKYPENTLVSFQAAVEAGVDAIEMDVQLTRDGVPVVIHDNTVNRTTNGRGRVDRLLIKEIRELDAGRWFSSRFIGQRIPTLQEVLDRFAGKALLNIEIKTYGKSEAAAPGDVERAVVRMVARRDAVAGVLVSSFGAAILANVRHLPHAPAVALISKKRFNKETLAACRELGVFSFHPRFDIITDPLVQAMHSAGIRVYAFGADTPGQIKQLASLQADGVIAKDPQEARRWWPAPIGGRP